MGAAAAAPKCCSTTRARRRTGSAARRRSLFVPLPARSARLDSRRRPHRGPRRVRIRRLHALEGGQGSGCFPRRTNPRHHARPRVPDVQRGNRSRAGIRSHPRVVLHALSDLRVQRRGGSFPATARSRSNEAYQFAFNETLGRDGGYEGGRAASVVRHQPVGDRRRRDDRRPPDERDARPRRGLRRTVLRPQRRTAS